VTLPRGTRSAGLAALAAVAVLLLATVFADNPVVRGLETQSLDLRFRLRGPRPPGPEVTIVLVDDDSLARLGRWPFARTLFADALDRLHRAGAKVVAFDLLFAEPDEPVPADLRQAAHAAAQGLTGANEGALRAVLDRLAESGRDARFAAAIRASGNVLLPIAFSFGGAPGEEPDWLSASAYARFDNAPQPDNFPLVPKSAALPIGVLATAAACARAWFPGNIACSTSASDCPLAWWTCAMHLA
jgi:adenylate cyclase